MPCEIGKRLNLQYKSRLAVFGRVKNEKGQFVAIVMQTIKILTPFVMRVHLLISFNFNHFFLTKEMPDRCFAKTILFNNKLGTE